MDHVVVPSSRSLKYILSDIFERKILNESKQKEWLVVERYIKTEYCIIVYSNIQENGNKVQRQKHELSSLHDIQS